MLEKDLPITTIVKRKIKPGKEEDYHRLILSISKNALNFTGMDGVNFIDPSPEDPYHTIIFRFKSLKDLNNWGKSQDRKKLLKKIDAITIKKPGIKQYKSLEHWFELEEASHLKSPPRYKMVVATIIGIYPVTTILLPAIRNNPYLKPIFSSNVWISSLISSMIVVWLMTYVVMPMVNKFLKSWLFKS